MADNVIISAGTGTTIATDQVGTVHYQKIKVMDGTPDSENALVVDSTGAVKTTLSGNATVIVGSALPSSANFIGLVTVANNPTLAGINSSATIYAVVNTGAAVGANVTLNPSPNYIGLVTAVQSNQPALVAGAAYVGLASVNIGGTLPALTAGSAYVGLVTAVNANQPALVASAAYIGLVTSVPSNTVRSISGNVTLSDSKGFIGLTTVTGSALDIRSLNSTATLYAVVNTSAPGVSNSIVTVANTPLGVTVGNAMVTVTLGTKLDSTNDSVDIKSGATVTPVSAWPDPKTYIGLVTATLSGSVNTGMTTLFPGPNYIGLASVNVGGTLPALSAGAAYIGLVTAVQSNQPALVAGAAYIGLATVTVGSGVGNIGFATVNQVNQPALVAGAAYIGLVTTVQSNQPALTAGVAGIGFATVYNAAGASWMGLVTANVGNSLNIAGTNQSILHRNVELSVTSVATLYVGTTGNAIFKITNVLLNANATTRVSIKSGPTYLTGNATIGVTLLPGGGWVENGSPMSPLYFGLASGAAIVIEKNDITTLVGGKVTFYDS